MTLLSSLMVRARLVAQNAYVPYSRFRVGAAGRSGNQVFVGCNVENSSFGLTICAERNAIFQAISSGCHSIDALALSCLDVTKEAAAGASMPCGACRQVLAEFADPNTPVEIDWRRRVHAIGVAPTALRL